MFLSFIRRVMDFYNRVIHNPDYSDISSDEDEDVSHSDSDTIAYSNDEESMDLIMISDEEGDDQQEVYRDTRDIVVTRSIGLNMTSVLVVKDGDVINEQRTMDIIVCENMDRQSATIFAQKKFGRNFYFSRGITETEFFYTQEFFLML